MVNGIIGKKIGMTQVFAGDGSITPVTVLKAGPCVVVQKKTVNTDGYNAVQLGLVEERPPRRVNRPRMNSPGGRRTPGSQTGSGALSKCA